MKIIIEGCDGTGKTTLAKTLAEMYQLDVVHMTNRDSNTFNFYREALGKEDVVWDRNLIGEIVYPKVFNRQSNIDEIDLEFLIKRAKASGVIFLILTTDMEEIKRRIIERGGEYESVIENLEFINTTFCEIATKYNLPLIDTSKVSVSEICKLYINEGVKTYG